VSSLATYGLLPKLSLLLQILIAISFTYLVVFIHIYFKILVCLRAIALSKTSAVIIFTNILYRI
jgi:hypothetical protein